MELFDSRSLHSDISSNLPLSQIEQNLVDPEGLKDSNDQRNWAKICLRMREFKKAKGEIAGDRDIDFQITR